MEKITIFTPTYNRAYILDRCYRSLCNQTSSDFKWLIVDDGSSDDTEELVLNWKKQNIINIEYYSQKNQGKMAAHNCGVEKCQTELFFCLDSDDYLYSNSVEKILSFWESKEDNENISGIVALKVIQKESKYEVASLPSGIESTKLIDLYNRLGYKSETSLIFKTNILKKYLFPIIKGEKFITENYIYDQLDQKYELFLLNEKITICEYLDDGYTAKSSEIIRNNPRGYSLYANQRLKYASTLSLKFTSAIQYNLGSWLSKNKRYMHESNNKFITFLTMPLGILLYIKKFKK